MDDAIVKFEVRISKGCLSLRGGNFFQILLYMQSQSSFKAGSEIPSLLLRPVPHLLESHSQHLCTIAFLLRSHHYESDNSKGQPIENEPTLLAEAAFFAKLYGGSGITVPVHGMSCIGFGGEEKLRMTDSSFQDMFLYGMVILPVNLMFSYDWN